MTPDTHVNKLSDSFFRELDSILNEVTKAFLEYRKSGQAASLIPVASTIAKYIATSLKDLYEDVRVITERDIFGIKTLTYYDHKSKTYVVLVQFRDDYLASRLYGVAVKVSDQLSKPLVPSQIPRLVRGARKAVEKAMKAAFRGMWTRIKADVSLFIVAYKHTLGCLDVVRELNEANENQRVRLFTNIMRFNRAAEVVDRVVDFLKYRAGSIALNFYNRYKDEIRKWGGVPDKAKKTLKSMLRVVFKLKSLLGHRPVPEDKIDAIATAMLVNGVSDPGEFL